MCVYWHYRCVFTGITRAFLRTYLYHAGVFHDSTGAFLRTPLYRASVFLGTTDVFFLALQMCVSWNCRSIFENTSLPCKIFSWHYRCVFPGITGAFLKNLSWKMEKEEAGKAAARAKEAERAKADRKKLEADRLGDRQSAERKEEKRRKDGERNRKEDDRSEARKRPEAGRAEVREREADRKDRHVRCRVVQDRLGPRPEEKRRRLSTSIYLVPESLHNCFRTCFQPL
jgi:hypothetical protein